MQRRGYNDVTKAQKCCKNNKKESEEINMKAGVIGAGRIGKVHIKIYLCMYRRLRSRP